MRRVVYELWRIVLWLSCSDSGLTETSGLKTQDCLVSSSGGIAER